MSNDIKATYLYEKFLLLFPSWEEKIESYSRKKEILILHTRSKNNIYFWLNGSDWVVSTNLPMLFKMKGDK